MYAFDEAIGAVMKNEMHWWMPSFEIAALFNVSFKK